MLPVLQEQSKFNSASDFAFLTDFHSHIPSHDLTVVSLTQRFGFLTWVVRRLMWMNSLSAYTWSPTSTNN